MLNQVTLMGRFTRDPELKYTANEKAVTSFALAVDRDIRGSDAVDFIDCVAWGKTAETISRYFRKGERVLAAGRIQARTWQDSSGNKRKAVEVIVDRAYFVEPKPRGDAAHTPEDGPFTELSDGDGELPF